LIKHSLASLLLIIVILILASVPSFVSLAQSQTSPSPSTEVLSLRTSNSKTINNQDGTYTITSSINDIHYKDTEGKWQDINTNIINYEIEEAPYNLEVYNTGSIGFNIESKNGGSVDIKLISLKEQGSDKNLLPSFGSPVTKNNIVTWSSQDIDINVEAYNTEVKLKTIIKKSISTSSDKLILEYDYIESPGEVYLTCRVKDSGTEENGEDSEVIFNKDTINNKLIETVTLRNVIYPLKIDPTISVKVASGSDDATMYWDWGSWNYRLVSYLYVGYNDSGQYKFGHGMRFTGISIPQATTITDSYIKYTCAVANTNTPVIARIIGNDVDNATTFSTQSDYQNRRGTIVGGANNDYITTASIDWPSIPEMPTIGLKYDTPDITSIIQEIIDRPGWVSGNAIVLWCDDYENRATGPNNTRRMLVNYEMDPNNPPELFVTYTIPPEIPSLYTLPASSILSTESTLNGNITSTGGENLITRGFVYDYIHHDDPGSITPSTSDYSYYYIEQGNFTTGQYEYTLENLPTGIQYYYRSVGNNSAGWNYGNETTFVTNAVTTGGIDMLPLALLFLCLTLTIIAYYFKEMPVIVCAAMSWVSVGLFMYELEDLSNNLNYGLMMVCVTMAIICVMNIPVLMNKRAEEYKKEHPTVKILSEEERYDKELIEGIRKAQYVSGKSTADRLLRKYRKR